MSKIRIIDDIAPEDLAMLQALYSRSPASVDDHLEKVRATGSGAFMDRYYVGYGHASIGDCGTTTIFVEGVSMLTAKAIQDWPLYSGQEASTRYMDFSSSTFHNPEGTERGAEIQEAWRSFYLGAREPMLEHLRRRHPRRKGESESVYERAIAARAFDVLRGFLPAGAATNLSWTTNLRQLSDHLDTLLVHPHPQVRAVAYCIRHEAVAKYPHSFRDAASHTEYRASAERQSMLTVSDLRWLEDFSWRRLQAECVHPGVRFRTEISEDAIAEHSLHAWQLLEGRPKGVLVPRQLAELGAIRSEFVLDYGSFRDLQRHRAGVVRMPLLTTELGFHPWYLEQLPVDLHRQALQLLVEQQERIAELDLIPVQQQDYVAMGYRVPCRVVQPLPAYIYRLELRSSKAVHPTLRHVILQEIAKFKAVFPNVALHVDVDEDDWTVRRGEQTITERPTEPSSTEPATDALDPNAPQPMPRPSDHPAVWDLVIEDMHQRDRMGAEKYGQRLKPHDGRDNDMDAYQEALDLAVYLRKGIYERTGR